MDDVDDIVQAFLVESTEGLDELDRDLVALEREPQSRERLTSIFRTVHTIKGTSGFLAYQRLERLTHVGETLLAQLRDGDRLLDADTTEALLSMVDAIRALLGLIERTGADDDDSVQLDEVMATLEELAAVEPATEQPADPAPVVTVTTAEAEPVVAAEPAPVVTPAPVTAPPVVAAPAEVVVEPASIKADIRDHAGDEPSTPNLVDTTVRVDVELLDTLVRLVGELVLTRNQIVQHAGAADDADLGRAAQRLDMVASELQENVMLTRMQPIGQAWTKFPRIVRDLATQLGKQVRLETSGQDTELDRSLLDAVKDPLTHLVRNAIDHGIETPERRLAAGKPAEGVLRLRSYHESGQVVVEIADDGHGLDAARIGDTAVRRGVINAADLPRMSERDLHELIFRPGFSTASAVTNVSGRGVGMDVVRTNIERIGGVVDLVSKPGHGTTFRVRIPLTLAIIPALLVTESGERFAIPQANLVELVRVADLTNGPEVSTIAGTTILRLRDQLLPLVRLATALDLPVQPRPDATVVVVQADGARFGLAVDEVHDTQEIVVKPLGRQLRSLPHYAGATIMGEGRVALILDVGGVAGSLDMDSSAVNVEEATEAGGEKTTSLLVLNVGQDRRAAMPLSKVSRLEEIASASIEHSGNIEAVQYRGGVLPLVRLAPYLGLPVTKLDTDTVPVVVHEDDGRLVGLVADSVVDLVEAVLTGSDVGSRPGVIGTAIVQERITDLIDVDAVVSAAGVGR